MTGFWRNRHMTNRSFVTPFLLAGVLCLSACQSGIKIEPVGVAPSPVKAAEGVARTTDRVTSEAVVHLRDQLTQNELAKAALADRLALYDWQGHQQIDQADARYQRLLTIFDDVHQRSHLADMALVPVLVEKDVFQAYTMGGLEIVFYTGLTDRLSDDGLAVIIGHEMAHIATAHALEAISRDVVNLARDHHDHSRLSGFYAVESEYEADMVGLLYAALAGYDASKAAEIWETLSEVAGRPEFNLFTSTHPPDQARARRLKAQAAAIASLRGAEDWQQALICNPLYCAP